MSRQERGRCISQDGHPEGQELPAHAEQAAPQAVPRDAHLEPRDRVSLGTGGEHAHLVLPQPKPTQNTPPQQPQFIHGR